MKIKNAFTACLPKARAGIEGFDETIHGGLPRWDLPERKKKSLFFLDVQPGHDMLVSGGFDLSGNTLADAYTAGGEVLMGTLRWEKEAAGRTAAEEGAVAAKLTQVTLESEEALIELRLKALQLEWQVKRAEMQALSLYVAGDGPNSAQAMANLNAICGEHLAERHEIEVVDVPREPQRALSDIMMLTPLLVKLSPAPMRKIIKRSTSASPFCKHSPCPPLPND